MKLFHSASALALAAALVAPPALAQDRAAPDSDTATIAELIVTAQKREENIQEAPVAVSAVTGAALEQAHIQNFSDLALSMPSLSYTENSPLDQEFNIRGVTNTRLDAPTADQSVGIFSDEVYVGRSGLVNTDFYDVGRVEVIRGPQGVLLGRNVVGGAISVITAEPLFEAQGRASFTYGNYDLVLFNGHVTGPLAEGLAGRLSIQSRNHSGYNRDILNNRDLDDLNSFQARAQLLYAPDGSDLRVRFIADYMRDESNGIHRVAIAAPGLPGTKPWSTTRAAYAARFGGLDIRESLPEHPLYRGLATPTPQFLNREAWGLTLKAEKGVAEDVTLASITAYKQGQGGSLYDQSGIGPDNPAGIISPFAFSFPVNEFEEIQQFSQEIRLTSNYGDASPLDWIVGGYFQQDHVKKFDRFWGEIPLTAVRTISGESHWRNSGKTRSYAVFGQVSYEITDQLQLTGGVRYTRDKKYGAVGGIAIENGDKFLPADTVALTPLGAGFAEGTGFVTNYSKTWSEVTPQGIVKFTPSDDLMIYASAAKGYKGGGFEDTPTNAAAAQNAFDPETVTSFEGGFKWDFWERRARLNVAVFHMKYKNMQVTQTNAGCLCNITDNAASSTIKGAELEFQVKPVRELLIWGGGSYLDATYNRYIDSTGVNNEGHTLQRTPIFQVNVGAELTLDVGDWEDALTARLEYNITGRQSWLPDNLNVEKAYGLLDGRIAFKVPDRDWTVAVWGRNLTDELYRTNIIAFFGDEVSTFGSPRTFGVELTTRF
jgi:iron complex outermembrane recepter protein